MWLLQALRDDYQVDFVTRGGWDLDDLNHCAGTHVTGEQLGQVRLPAHTLLKRTTGGALWHGLFLRYCRRIAPPYDLCITASRVVDWGVPAVHFLSDVAWHRALRLRKSQKKWFDHVRWDNAYSHLGELLGGRSGRPPVLHDLFVANSQWTAQLSAEFCKQPPVVIYPAVPGDFPDVPWDARENAFICLGRISPVKKIELVIATLEQVRALGHAIRLHLVGAFDKTPYARQIEALCEAQRHWIVLQRAVYGERKAALLSRCRFGISACDREAFGIATAEMMRAGIVPFVPRDGAQPEVVQEEALIYQDVQDAVVRIDAVLRSKSRQAELHAAMVRRGAAFKPEHFCAAIRELVAKHLRSLNKLQVVSAHS
ncbi:MAG: glycosyltransferase family 4 protein [Verrucomicrobia bacterium]|nr:glycosyltransferase family 4 protein [Verrucomicrobiota bacterium]